MKQPGEWQPVPIYTRNTGYGGRFRCQVAISRFSSVRHQVPSLFAFEGDCDSLRFLSHFAARLEVWSSNMGGLLNPYREWLGIQTADIPSSHYELLGLPQFEADPQQIRTAYDARRGQVSRCVTTEQEGALATALLRELSAAFACLSDPQAKAAYDARLRMGATPKATREVTRGTTSARRSDITPMPQPAVTPSPTSPQRGQVAAQPSISIPVSAHGNKAHASPAVTATKSATERKQPRSMSIEIVKIVIGGVVGLAIASVLLFVLGVNPWGDPQPVRRRQTVERGGQGDRVVTAPAGDDGPELPAPPSGDPFRPVAAEDSADERVAADPAQSASSLGSPAAGAKEAGQSKRVTWAPEYTLNDLTSRREQLAVACRQVQPMLTNPGALSETDKTALSIEFIRALQLFAEELTFCAAADQDVEGVLAALTESVASITDTASKRRVLAEIASSIVKANDRARQGILLLGVVDDMQLVDGLYKTTLRIPSATAETISVWSWQDPAADCQVGAVVVSFAVIIDAPTENLHGYTGSEKTVAWTRHLQTIGQ